MIPVLQAERAIEKFFQENGGWKTKIAPSVEGGLTGVFYETDAGFCWPIDLSQSDLMAGPMEFCRKLDAVLLNATRRMCSGVAI